MTTPEFSVIMPTYNRAAFIGRAVNSALEQTFENFELIVVDDGSTDETMEVLESVNDKRLHVVTQENGGPAVARNHGLARAIGRTIAYLDSDNNWYPDYLSVVSEELTEPYVAAYTGQNLFLVGGSVEDQKIIGRKTKSVEYNPTTFQRINLIDIGCFSHRADILKVTGNFDAAQPWAEDWDLMARIAIHYPYYVKHIDQTLSAYYAYMPEVMPTMTNQVPGWSDGIKGYFGVQPAKERDRRLTRHIIEMIREHYPFPDDAAMTASDVPGRTEA
jgi:glycosyltransferase involved in cell wall biosynthesis